MDSAGSVLRTAQPLCGRRRPGQRALAGPVLRDSTEAKRGPDGKHYVVPIDLVTTFFFYNKNIFDEAGLSAPSTYGEWIEVQEALLGTDTIPNARLAWYQSQVGAMLYAKKDDIINADGGVASLEEVGCAMKNGLYSATDPEYGDWFRLVKPVDSLSGAGLGGRGSGLQPQVPPKRCGCI